MLSKMDTYHIIKRSGVWCLVSGVWCLVSGVWLAQGFNDEKKNRNLTPDNGQSLRDLKYIGTTSRVL